MELSYDEAPPAPPAATEATTAASQKAPAVAAAAAAIQQPAVALSSVSFIPKFSFLKEKVRNFRNSHLRVPVAVLIYFFLHNNMYTQTIDNLAVATHVIEEDTLIFYKDEDGKDVFLKTTHTILVNIRVGKRGVVCLAHQYEISYL